MSDLALDAAVREFRDALAGRGGVVLDELALPAGAPRGAPHAFPERVRFEVSVGGRGVHTVSVTPVGVYVAAGRFAPDAGRVSGHTGSAASRASTPCRALDRGATRARRVVEHLGSVHADASTVELPNATVRALHEALGRVDVPRLTHRARLVGEFDLPGVLDRSGLHGSYVVLDLHDVLVGEDLPEGAYPRLLELLGLLADDAPLEWVARRYADDEE